MLMLTPLLMIFDTPTLIVAATDYYRHAISLTLCRRYA